MIDDEKWQILEDKPDLSRWSLKYKAFGQSLEFSWLARNMQVNVINTWCSHVDSLELMISHFLGSPNLFIFAQPIPNQKIHWRSLEGLPNR